MKTKSEILAHYAQYGIQNHQAQFRQAPHQKSRGQRLLRCNSCWLPNQYCVCSKLHKIDNIIQIIIAMHWKESSRSSNTGRLASLVLKNSYVYYHGLPFETFTVPTAIEQSSKIGVLFPSQQALDLETLPSQQRPDVLIVPDASWRQAKRMLKREPQLQRYPHYRLPVSLNSAYHLRKAPNPGQLSTAEAIIHAFEILGEKQSSDKLRNAFQLFIEQSLYTRGRPDLVTSKDNRESA